MTTIVTVDDYIVTQASEAQPRLRELRAIIRAAVPRATEVISYGMPTYKLGGSRVHFGAAKRHYHDAPRGPAADDGHLPR
jgi:uncharacterized protein YdhG (YjbR/CyaY superfamily)